MVTFKELLDTIEYAADILMCDKDNDNPCTAEPESEEDDMEDCNPCHVRRELWKVAAKGGRNLEELALKGGGD